ncbi:hypothetical protein WOLCODRAFT_135256 [Wolfiporia cocos MD-104 SS10]|uniref:Uncharacterized protein n=1 Tax=Wolfiporia cocos (strain MD-104) TaxID=742152 RepID=A0A2H3JCJ7_WOLCO|nr:hypothetical protein WOLCODRAFT_135256 [Wolfiporia cocos MD-104 SS10]
MLAAYYAKSSPQLSHRKRVVRNKSWVSCAKRSVILLSSFEIRSFAIRRVVRGGLSFPDQLAIHVLQLPGQVMAHLACILGEVPPC